MSDSFMLRFIRKMFLATTACVAVIATSPLALADKDADLERAKDRINSDKTTKGAVRKDAEHGRVSVETKSGVGVYGEAGGKQPSHDNPKGEKKGGAGVQLRFGGSDGKENNK